MLEILQVLQEIHKLDPNITFGHIINGSLLRNESISNISDEKMLHDIILYKCMLQKERGDNSP